MSVCKPFFLGEIDSDLLFPYPTMAADEGETLAILLDSLERFALVGGHRRVREQEVGVDLTQEERLADAHDVLLRLQRIPDARRAR